MLKMIKKLNQYNKKLLKMRKSNNKLISLLIKKIIQLNQSKNKLLNLKNKK